MNDLQSKKIKWSYLKTQHIYLFNEVNRHFYKNINIQASLNVQISSAIVFCLCYFGDRTLTTVKHQIALRFDPSQCDLQSGVFITFALLTVLGDFNFGFLLSTLQIRLVPLSIHIFTKKKNILQRFVSWLIYKWVKPIILLTMFMASMVLF